MNIRKYVINIIGQEEQTILLTSEYNAIQTLTKSLVQYANLKSIINEETYTKIEACVAGCILYGISVERDKLKTKEK